MSVRYCSLFPLVRPTRFLEPLLGPAGPHRERRPSVRYDSLMSLPPHCDRAEWLRRATEALAKFKPDYTPEELASVVNGELWDEACDLPPEEAAEIYASETGAE